MPAILKSVEPVSETGVDLFTAELVLPALAILVPTVIAVSLFAAERRAAYRANARDRLLRASADVIRALAPMASIHPTEPMQEKLWDLRARIAVYRTWIEPNDISGDWLDLRHREGVAAWAAAMSAIDAAGGPLTLALTAQSDLLRAPHLWAATTIEMLSKRIRYELKDEQIREDASRIINELGLDAQQ